MTEQFSTITSPPLSRTSVLTIIHRWECLSGSSRVQWRSSNASLEQKVWDRGFEYGKKTSSLYPHQSFLQVSMISPVGRNENIWVSACSSTLHKDAILSCPTQNTEVICKIEGSGEVRAEQPEFRTHESDAPHQFTILFYQSPHGLLPRASPQAPGNIFYTLAYIHPQCLSALHASVPCTSLLPWSGPSTYSWGQHV